MNVGINGFGRIGRNFLRAILLDEKARKTLTVRAINVGNRVDPQMVAHFFKYDTILGSYPGHVCVKGDVLVVDDYKIALRTEVDPTKISWKTDNVDWVLDATGVFTKREQVEKHLQAGAQAVLISAPSSDADVTIIPGINDNDFDATLHTTVSLGSCTTNALAHMIKILDEKCVIVTGYMTTVHAYTNAQVLLDVERSDPRRARAAALNIIPTTTGAAKVIDILFPHLKGKIAGSALRVPIANVSLVNLSCVVKQPNTKEQVNEYFKSACKGELSSIIGVTHEPLVSSDFGGDSRSVIIDCLSTTVVGNLITLFGWYDNEWGYSCRLRDFLCGV